MDANLRLIMSKLRSHDDTGIDFSKEEIDFLLDILSGYEPYVDNVKEGGIASAYLISNDIINEYFNKRDIIIDNSNNPKIIHSEILTMNEFNLRFRPHSFPLDLITEEE